MKISIIGRFFKVLSTLQEISFLKFEVNLFIIDKNDKQLKNFINEGNSYHFSFYNNSLTSFIADSEVLIIDIEERNLLNKIINKWSRQRKQGMLIFNNISEYGFGDKIYNRINKDNNNIEVVIFPNFVNLSLLQQEKTVLILGGDPYSKYIKQIRKELTKNSYSLLIVERSEAEMIQLLFQSFLSIQQAYIIEVEEILKRLNLDIEVIKKGLNGIKVNLFEKIFFPKPINTSIIKYSKPNMVNMAEKIIKNDEDWAIKQVKKLNPSKLKHIALWGIDSINTIKKLLQLPIEKIFIFPLTKKYIVSTRLIYLTDPLLAVKNADLLLILDHHPAFSSIPLKELDKIYKNKAIIDKLNLFELNEIKAFNFIYISKGRPIVNNSNSLRE